MIDPTATREESPAERTVRLWEQHGMTLMMAIMTASLFYFANATIDAKTAQATTAEKLTSVNQTLARLEGSITSMQLVYITRAEFDSLHNRVIRLESK